MDINIWAILVATVVGYSIGGLWYTPKLFAHPWLAETGLTVEKIRANPSKMPFIVAFLANLVIATALAFIHARLVPDLSWGAFGNGVGLGLMTGVGVAAAAAAPHYAFQGSSRKLFLIDYGQTLASIVAMSLILALWP